MILNTDRADGGSEAAHMSKKNPQVDAYMSNLKHWQHELARLRTIALASGLTEELKWRLPCYTLQGSNVAILQDFKDYCALMFFKGALLKDPKHILVAPGAAQAARQARFTNVAQISAAQPVLKAYLAEAIGLEKAGAKVTLKQTAEFKIPEEFRRRLSRDPALKAAFQALTPGRQRGYLHYFAQPKQSRTREARIEKCRPRILKGRGLND
jgi:uncharacterized protein YdeI (YjbR/CyaY-like superfamily)